jgi:hypothetical protein
MAIIETQNDIEGENHQSEFVRKESVVLEKI